MQIWVISLPQSIERRTHIAAQLAQFGLEYRFFDAVDGAEGLAAHFDGQDDKTFLANTGRRAGDGEIGCFASHALLWKKCIASGEPIVVVEDDAEFDERFPDALSVVSMIIEQYGFVRLQEEWKGGRSRIAQHGGFDIVSFASFPLGAQCYAVAPDAARALLNQSYIFDAPVDVYIKRFWVHGQPLFALHPAVVTASAHSARTTIIREPGAGGMRLAIRRFWAKFLGVAQRTRYRGLLLVRVRY